MPRSKVIALRLGPAELSSLRQIPGASDSERVRALIQNAGVSGEFARVIAAAVAKEIGQKIATAVAADGGLTRQDFHRRLGELVAQLDAILKNFSQLQTKR